MELTLYRADDGDYDLRKGRPCGFAVCWDGLDEYTKLGSPPDVLYVKFFKKEPAHGHGFTYRKVSDRWFVLGNEGEEPKIELWDDFQNALKDAYEQGYRWFEFQTEE